MTRDKGGGVTPKLSRCFWAYGHYGAEMTQMVRKLALTILNNSTDDGVDMDVWAVLSSMLEDEGGNDDILDNVYLFYDRWYLTQGMINESPANKDH